mmetsp:Transcript_39320/g.121578  ORF Transcript_39320/g.121578 Transcript_39320/m.121578 type:complete len:239 (-) Transcript_39320:300-1016(-)
MSNCSWFSMQRGPAAAGGVRCRFPFVPHRPHTAPRSAHVRTRTGIARIGALARRSAVIRNPRNEPFFRDAVPLVVGADDNGAAAQNRPAWFRDVYVYLHDGRSAANLFFLFVLVFSFTPKGHPFLGTKSLTGRSVFSDDSVYTETFPRARSFARFVLLLLIVCRRQCTRAYDTTDLSRANSPCCDPALSHPRVACALRTNRSKRAARRATFCWHWCPGDAVRDTKTHTRTPTVPLSSL